MALDETLKKYAEAAAQAERQTRVDTTIEFIARFTAFLEAHNGETLGKWTIRGSRVEATLTESGSGSPFKVTVEADHGTLRCEFKDYREVSGNTVSVQECYVMRPFSKGENSPGIVFERIRNTTESQSTILSVPTPMEEKPPLLAKITIDAWIERPLMDEDEILRFFIDLLTDLGDLQTGSSDPVSSLFVQR